MRPAFRPLTLLTILGTLSTLTVSSPDTAHADTLQTLLGEPGSSGWQTACEDEIDEIYSSLWAPLRPNPKTPFDKETGLEAGGFDVTSQLEACESSDPFECLHYVQIDTDTYPNAVCSDGTPGAFYIRPGKGLNANRWVIHLQGGGSCTNYEDCVERWCGTQGVYSANKMSTNWFNMTAAGGLGPPDLLWAAIGLGMRDLIFESSHDLEDWTHVYVYYCSSDNWMGRKTNVTFTNAAGTKTLDLAARGHTILAIMRKMLRRNGPTGTDWHPDDLDADSCDPDVEGVSADMCIPDLDAATDIIFSGTSAGAVGAVQNADWFLSMFPNARTALALDGAITPTPSAANDNGIVVEWPVGSGAYVSYEQGYGNLLELETQPGGYHHAINAFIDETCEQAQALSPLGFKSDCWHMSGLLGGGFVSTSTFIRFALTDAVIYGVSTMLFEEPNGSGGFKTITLETFASLMRDTLVDLHTNTTAVDGVFAPQCGTHVGFSLQYSYFWDLTEDVVEDASGAFIPQGSDSTAHDALWAWYDVSGSNTQSTRYIDSPDLLAPTADCSH